MKNKSKKIFIIILILIIISIVSFFIIQNKKNSQTISNIDANIFYVDNGTKYILENNKKFNCDNPISITWDVDENGFITKSNNEKEKINKDFSLNQPGKYTITVGKKSINFEVIQESIEQYISFDSNNNKIILHNIDDITRLEVDKKIFTKKENNIPTEYIFTSTGKYPVIIETITQSSLSNTYRITNKK